MNLRDLNPVSSMHPEAAILLAALENATEEFRREIGEVSDDLVGWRPAPGMHSIGAILLHLADAEGWWIEEVLLRGERSAEEKERLQSDLLDQYDVDWPDPPSQPIEWYYAQQDAVRARTSQRLAGLTEPFPTGGHEYYGDRQYTLRWIMAHLVAHEAYHGGQAVLLKLMKESGRFPAE